MKSVSIAQSKSVKTTHVTIEEGEVDKSGLDKNFIKTIISVRSLDD